METIKSKTVFYPQFHIGNEPTAVECEIYIVDANGRRYVKTPFAMIDCFADDDLERMVQSGRGYYSTREECEAYLSIQYPHWETAAPIGEAILTAIQYRGKLMGDAHIEEKTGLNNLTGILYRAARGERGISLKAIKSAVKALATK